MKYKETDAKGKEPKFSIAQPDKAAVLKAVPVKMVIFNLVDGRQATMGIKGEIDPKLAKSFEAAFSGKKLKGDEGSVSLDFDKADLDKDGIVRISERLLVYRIGDAFIATDSRQSKVFASDFSPSHRVGNVFLPTESNEPKAIAPGFRLSTLANAKSLDDYFILRDGEGAPKKFMLKSSFEGAPEEYDNLLNPSSRIIGENKYFLLIENKNNTFMVDKRRTVANEPVPSENFIVANGKETEFGRTHGMVAGMSSDGAQLFASVIEDSSKRVVVVGENHDGSTHYEFLASNIDLLAKNNFAIGLEVSADTKVQLYYGFNDKDGHSVKLNVDMALGEFFERYNEGEYDKLPQPVTDMVVHGVLSDGAGLSDAAIKFIQQCHKKGLELVPMEEREKVLENYYLKNGRPTLTRDYFMAKNIASYPKENPDKRVLMVVGANHLADKPAMIIINTNAVGNRIDYTEKKSLGMRLRESLGNSTDFIVMHDWPYRTPQSIRAECLQDEHDMYSPFPAAGYDFKAHPDLQYNLMRGLSDKVIMFQSR